jgi:hypothetical protein
LTRRFQLCILDRADDPIVFQFAEEFFRSHAPTNFRSSRHHQSCRHLH